MITITKGTMEYLAAENISAPHGFTTRRGGVSEGCFRSLNLTHHRGDSRENVEENLRRLGAAIGFSPENLVLTRQTHTDIVRVVTGADRRGTDHREYPECDGLVTNTPGLALMVFTADCTPILLHDPVTGAVGAVHAGWRGTAADIAGKAVNAMVAAFGCAPENIHAAIGPNIGRCCFQTDADVPQAMLRTFGQAAQEFIHPQGDKHYVNLKKINALALGRAGVTSIDISEDCTMCQSDRFWSHRVTGAARGSQGAVIVCREATP